MGVTRPEDARVAIRADPGDLVKMAIPTPPPPFGNTHTHTPSLVVGLPVWPHPNSELMVSLMICRSVGMLNLAV